MAETAENLLRQCASHWQLTSPLVSKILRWGSHLHEIGLDISHDAFQQHGAYIAENAELPGFPRSEQSLLAFVIASQRGPFDLQKLQRLPSSMRCEALRISIIHRLAVLLNRSRSPREMPPIILDVSGESIRLQLPADWLSANQLTVADLAREQRYLAGVDISLEVT